MVFDKKFQSVTFWDVKDNRKWELKNRIAESEIDGLKKFLNPNIK